MFIVIVGNPADGLTFHGPFSDAEEAGEWAEYKRPNEEWWIVKLQRPAERWEEGD